MSMTKDERDEIDGWWIITSYDQPQGPYFSKRSEPIDEYKGMNVYAVDGSCRGDFHDCELKEIEAYESAKIVDALDEKDAEIERWKSAANRAVEIITDQTWEDSPEKLKPGQLVSIAKKAERYRARIEELEKGRDAYKKRCEEYDIEPHPDEFSVGTPCCDKQTYTETKIGEGQWKRCCGCGEVVE